MHRSAGIYRLAKEQQQPFLEHCHTMMRTYPEKDPRIFPFTGRVPAIPDAEAKEQRYYKLLESIRFLRANIAKYETTAGGMLKGVTSHLRSKLVELEAELNALLAELN